MFTAYYPAGVQPLNDWFAPDTTQRHPLGTKVSASDPFWGFGDFVYVKALSTMEKGSLVQLDELYTASDVPATANLGRPVFVLMNSMVSGQFGWAQASGFAPISANASVAADTAIGIGAAGQAGTNVAGRQILGARNRIPGTGTTAKANTQTTTNSSVLVTRDGYDGWFLGMALSGTGIPASTVVAALSADGRTVLMGSAIGVVDRLATATGSVTVTGTWTNYLGVVFNNPMAQGAIT